MCSTCARRRPDTPSSARTSPPSPLGSRSTPPKARADSSRRAAPSSARQLHASQLPLAVPPHPHYASSPSLHTLNPCRFCQAVARTPVYPHYTPWLSHTHWPSLHPLIAPSLQPLTRRPLLPGHLAATLAPAAARAHPRHEAEAVRYLVITPRLPMYHPST